MGARAHADFAWQTNIRVGTRREGAPLSPPYDLTSRGMTRQRLPRDRARTMRHPTRISSGEPPAWLQVAPFAAVFVVFFLVPLALTVMVSFWDYNDYQILPAFTVRSSATPSSGSRRPRAPPSRYAISARGAASDGAFASGPSE